MIEVLVPVIWLIGGIACGFYVVNDMMSERIADLDTADYAGFGFVFCAAVAVWPFILPLIGLGYAIAKLRKR